MISVYNKLDNPWDEPTMLKKVTVTPASGYKQKGRNVGNGVRFTNTRPTHSTHHYETDDYGVEDFNYTSIDLPTVNNILIYNGGEEGGGNADCCVGGGSYDSGGGDYDCDGGGDCGGYDS